MLVATFKNRKTRPSLRVPEKFNGVITPTKSRISSIKLQITVFGQRDDSPRKEATFSISPAKE